jgi:hypothetical protein
MMIPTLALNWRSRREIVAAIPLKTLGWYPIMKVSRLNTHLKMGTDCNSIALDSPAQIGLRLSQSCTTKLCRFTLQTVRQSSTRPRLKSCMQRHFKTKTSASRDINSALIAARIEPRSSCDEGRPNVVSASSSFILALGFYAWPMLFSHNQLSSIPTCPPWLQIWRRQMGLKRSISRKDRF